MYLPPSSCPKIQTVMLQFQSNYNLLLQEIRHNHPKSSAKLAGDCIGVQLENDDGHRFITTFLKNKDNKFFTIQPPKLSPHQRVDYNFADANSMVAELKSVSFLI
ncbi:hypothetical protein NPIL_97961 [Nephila pilipes]|uniref:Uncharacterized protein n=1 Tax=Nephila pilipes TaxID=299642 RepID=A0A8X6P5H8_NEPPI|nr:hypothetical protein NPIL_97961 [Nephila pilipes]